MNKALIVAASEFASFVRTKAFIISIVLSPLLGLGMIGLERFVEKQTDTTERRFAIVDQTGVLADALERAAAEWNASVSGPPPTGPRYVPERVAVGPAGADATRLALSERVSRNDLYAFVEIPAGAVDDEAPARLRYYSSHPTYTALPRWIEHTISTELQARRFRAAAIDPALVARLTRAVGIDELGLVERDARGEVRPATKVDRVRTIAIPMVLMMLIFMPVMVICPQLVQSVLEEKMSRISEVLLGSVTPFELMLGKLLGAGAVCVVITLSYVAMAAVSAVYWGYADILGLALIVEFVAFLSLAMLFYGSLYIAVGAASTTMKDSQGLMTPVMLLSMLPILVVSMMLRAPEGPLAVGMSLFPPSAPYVMMFRLAMRPGPPIWQVLLAFVLTAAAALGCVWAAGRVFRVGLLAQGKAPSLADLVKWVRA